MTYARDDRVRDLAVAFGTDQGAQNEAIADAGGKAASAQQAAGKTPDDFDGSLSTALADADDLVIQQEYSTGQLTPKAGQRIRGRGKLRRTATGNLVNAPAKDGLEIDGLTLDMNRAGLGTATGHGLSISADRVKVSNLTVLDHGSSDANAGAALNGSGEFWRVEGMFFSADPLATQGLGWVTNTKRSFYRDIYVENALGGIGYAHELKNNARSNHISGMIARKSNVALAYGQETGQAPLYNYASGLVSEACDRAYTIGAGGTANVLNGFVHDGTDSAGNTERHVVRFSGAGNSKNVVYAGASYGTAERTAYLNSADNYIQVASYDASPIVVEFASGGGNVVEITHPGSRSSILGAVADGTGHAQDGATANIVRSEATGERLGSRSGRFRDVLVPVPGGAVLSENKYVMEHNGPFTMGLLTSDAAGTVAGLHHHAGSVTRRGQFVHVLGATTAGDYWAVRTGQTDVLRVETTALTPASSAGIYALGSSTRRWSDAYATRIRPGAGAVIWTSGTGSPEGSVSAPVGSMFTRTDGGAGTTLYVKESGSGATGWVAK